jgi:hypothetical protein
MKPSISEKPLKSSFSRRFSTDRQSITPQPVKTVRESISDGRASRLRSFSLSKGYDSDGMSSLINTHCLESNTDRHYLTRSAPIKVEKASRQGRPLKPGVTLGG